MWTNPGAQALEIAEHVHTRLGFDRTKVIVPPRRAAKSYLTPPLCLFCMEQR
jgi:hypothetical protein